jgi:hypothetical protein
MLNDLIAILSKIQIKIEETERINNGNVVVVGDIFPLAFHFAFLGKVGYCHANCLNQDSQDSRINRNCRRQRRIITRLWLKTKRIGVKYYSDNNPGNLLILRILVQTNEVQRERGELRMFVASYDSRGFRHNPPWLNKIGCNKWCAIYNEWHTVYNKIAPLAENVEKISSLCTRTSEPRWSGCKDLQDKPQTMETKQ